MAKKGGKASADEVAPDASITVVRDQIDVIDKELVRLVNERAKCALEIGKIKRAQRKKIYAPNREEAVIQRAIDNSQGPLSAFCIRAVFRELISGSRALEKVLRVAYLGPEYTYSHLAAIERFGSSVDLVPVASISAVFEEVSRGHTDFGLVPLENSTDGRIADTLDNFTRTPLRICGEVQLRIHHNLLGKGARSEVQEVHSKPQALSQCRGWLSKHLPAARTVEVTSTTTAVQNSLQKPGVAAIASREAGVHYGLDVLAENIEDNQGNVTRFAVIGDLAPSRTGRDKTAVMFQIAHEPGSLADTMTIFKRNRLNMTWIESFPLQGAQEGYLFFVEFTGHEDDEAVKKALSSLERKTLKFEILGSYPASMLVDDT